MDPSFVCEHAGAKSAFGGEALPLHGVARDSADLTIEWYNNFGAEGRKLEEFHDWTHLTIPGSERYVSDLVEAVQSGEYPEDTYCEQALRPAITKKTNETMSETKRGSARRTPDNEPENARAR